MKLRKAMIAESDFIAAVKAGAKIAIRWRKASATEVVYIAGHVYESGFFESAEGKAEEIADHFDIPLSRVQIETFKAKVTSR